MGLFSQSGSELVARRTTAEYGTEPGKELEDHMDGARVKLGGASDDEMLRAWRIKEIKDIAYSGRKVDGRLGEFEKDDLVSSSAIEGEVLAGLMGFRLE